MRLLEILTAIEFIGRDQSALFHLVEDVLHVDEVAARHVKIESGAPELLDQKGNVEFIAVVAGDVAIGENRMERLRHLRERGAILHVFVGDMVHCRACRRNGHSRIQTTRLAFLMAVGIDLDVAQLHNAVVHHIGAGRLQVEKYERAGQIQFHNTCIGIWMITRSSPSFCSNGELMAGRAGSLKRKITVSSAMLERISIMNAPLKPIVMGFP